MIKNPIIYVLAVVILALGAFFLFNNLQPKTTSSITAEQDETAEQIAVEKAKAKNQQLETTETNSLPRYVTYSPLAFEAAKEKKKVYFFHATWCETCFAANKEFTEQHDLIPKDVMLFKTDYDTEKELKKQYGITYQHTFVYVGEDGKQIKKWSGGAIDDLIANTK